MLFLLCLGGALVLTWYLGAHSAREKERKRISQGQISRFELDLLRAQGNRIHPDPSAAGRVSRARFVR